MLESTWNDYADAFAFMGNSLLDTMHHTGDAGLKPEFWAAFPDFGSDAVSSSLDALFAYAQQAQERIAAGDDVATEVSVEFTRLFVGPPSPAVQPWQTAYGNGNASVGFGQATFGMQQVLRNAGLEKASANNQYADHMGIELLVLSEMCRALHEHRPLGTYDSPEAVVAYVHEYPHAWVAAFAARVRNEAPDGYYAHLLDAASALLDAFVG